MICRSFVEKSSAFLFAREEKVNNRQRKEFKRNVRFSLQAQRKGNGIAFACKEKENDNKHTKCKISDTADSKRVYGVFAAWDNDDDCVNDMYVTAVGTHVVRINKDVTVSAGDLLVSNGDGTAKKLSGDTSMTADVYSSIIGKVLTNIKQETYDDGSYTVPCALYCG